MDGESPPVVMQELGHADPARGDGCAEPEARFGSTTRYASYAPGRIRTSDFCLRRTLAKSALRAGVPLSKRAPARFPCIRTGLSLCRGLSWFSGVLGTGAHSPGRCAHSGGWVRQRHHRTRIPCSRLRRWRSSRMFPARRSGAPRCRHVGQLRPIPVEAPPCWAGLRGVCLRGFSSRRSRARARGARRARGSDRVERLQSRSCP